MNSGDAFPSSWYPVCASHQVSARRPLAVCILGVAWIVFRGAEGRCVVVQRYCCHMGSDLARGSVIDSFVRCPLHHWRFAGTGACVDIPGRTDIPANARLMTLRCEEHFGIVFVKHGDDDSIDYPIFADAGELRYSRPRIIRMAASYVTVSLNLFDVQHLVTVHQRVLTRPPEHFSDSVHHLGVRYSVENARPRIGNHIAVLLGMSARDIRVDCWGGNLLLISIKGSRPDFIMALAPVDPGNCRVFMATLDRARGGSAVAGIAQSMALELAALLTRSFIAEDIKILSNSKTTAGVLLPDLDAGSLRFWEYFNSLPRSQPQSRQ